MRQNAQYSTLLLYHSITSPFIHKKIWIFFNTDFFFPQIKKQQQPKKKKKTGNHFGGQTFPDMILHVLQHLLSRHFLKNSSFRDFCVRDGSGMTKIQKKYRDM